MRVYLVLELRPLYTTHGTAKIFIFKSLLIKDIVKKIVAVVRKSCSVYGR